MLEPPHRTPHRQPTGTPTPRSSTTSILFAIASVPEERPAMIFPDSTQWPPASECPRKFEPHVAAIRAARTRPRPAHDLPRSRRRRIAHDMSISETSGHSGVGLSLGSSSMWQRQTKRRPILSERESRWHDRHWESHSFGHDCQVEPRQVQPFRAWTSPPVFYMMSSSPSVTLGPP